MKKPTANSAFIDSQNINLGFQALGWKLDWRRFRVYLEEKYAVGKAYLFIGYIPENQQLYTSLQQAGFILVFKPVLQTKERGAKGNVDADLVLKAMTEYGNYEKALIITSDGDFYSRSLKPCSAPARRSARRSSKRQRRSASTSWRPCARSSNTKPRNEKAPPRDGTQGSA